MGRGSSLWRIHRPEPPVNENSVVAMTALMEISAVQDQNRPFSRTESFSHQRSEEGFGDQQRSAVTAKA